jgi:hypothetical protein
VACEGDEEEFSVFLQSKAGWFGRLMRKVNSFVSVMAAGAFNLRSPGKLPSDHQDRETNIVSRRRPRVSDVYAPIVRISGDISCR